MFRNLIALTFSASLAMAQVGVGGSGVSNASGPVPSIFSIQPLGLVNGNFRYQVLGSNFGASAGSLCLTHAATYDVSTNSFMLSDSRGVRWVVVCDPVLPTGWTDNLVTFDTPAFTLSQTNAPASIAEPILVLTNSVISALKQTTIATTVRIPLNVISTAATYAHSITAHPPAIDQSKISQGTCVPTGGLLNSSPLSAISPVPCVTVAGTGFGSNASLVIPSIHTWARIDGTNQIFLSASQPLPQTIADVIFEMWNPCLNNNAIMNTYPFSGVTQLVSDTDIQIAFTAQSSSWPVSVSNAELGSITLGYVFNANDGLISPAFSFRPPLQ